MRPFVGRYFPLLIAVFVLVSDFISKQLTHEYLPLMRSYHLWYPYGGIGVFKDFFGIEFSLSHQINRGAAWGMLSDFQMPLLYARIALICILVAYVLWWNTHIEWRIPLVLVTSGALGNVIDYYLYGHVIDMFHFVLWGYDFPVFNIADNAIFVGIVWILATSFFEKKTNVKINVKNNRKR